MPIGSGFQIMAVSCPPLGYFVFKHGFGYLSASIEVIYLPPQVIKIEKKPKLPQIKTGAPKKTDPSQRPANVPCTHPHLETEACPNVLLSGAECKLVNCSASGLQHNFPEDFLDSLGQEFCLRHLRNRVCTRALPPFICSSRQHVESPGPVLAFYRSYRQRVYKNCANCCQKISEDLPIEQKKDPSKMETKFNAQSTPTIYSKSAEEGGKAKAAVKDFCGHIKFRMNLCRFRDKTKCQRTGSSSILLCFLPSSKSLRRS